MTVKGLGFGLRLGFGVWGFRVKALCCGLRVQHSDPQEARGAIQKHNAESVHQRASPNTNRSPQTQP